MIEQKASDPMKKQHSALCVLALGLLGTAALHADPAIDSLTVGPQTPTPITRGDSASYSITVTKTVTPPKDVYLTIPDLPPGVTATFSPNPIPMAVQSTMDTATLT